ncbi:MAG: bifunctional UDP-sugar hydrolase/5'-nucleotidase [Acidobacteriota bacterium]
MSRTSRILPLVLSLAIALPAGAARLLIVHANDTHGHALPYGDDDDIGGMARLATVVRQAKTSEQNTLFLNAGDTFEGTMFFNAGLGEYDFALLQMMQCDGLAIGNHDFAVGTQILFNSFTGANPTYPFFGANMNLTGVSQVLDPILIGNYTAGAQDPMPYVVRTMPNGVKVGMFGVVTSETASLQPESVNDGVQFYGATTTPSIYTICQNIVNTLRTTENVDIVIMLSHLGYSQGANEDDQKVAQNVTGIDVIIGGHTHTPHPTPDVVNGTILVYAGAYSRYAGTLDLDVDIATNQVTMTSYRLDELNALVPLDPTIDAAIAGYKALVEAKYPGAYSFPIAKNRTLFDGARDAESGLGNIITDAYMATTGSQCAIENTGSIRFDGFRGNIYPAEIFNILSLDYTPAIGTTAPLKVTSIFGTVPATAQVTQARGQPLFKAILELLVSDLLKALQPTAGAFEFGGVTFVYDGAQPDFSRVSSIAVGGQPYNPAATYTTALSENLAQQFPLVDSLLFDLVGKPNELGANTITTIYEPWGALSTKLGTLNRTTCPDNDALGRARTLAPNLAFRSDCGIDVDPRRFTPNAAVTFTMEVLNLGMTASTPTTLDVYYEASPQDTVPNLTLAGTANVPAVPAWAGGVPGAVQLTLNWTVPGNLAAGSYPLRFQIATATGELLVNDNTMDIHEPPPGNVITGHGAGAGQDAEVRIFDADGAQAASFFPYASTGYGVDVAANDIDGKAPGRDEALTGPGPSPVFGPQVRAFQNIGTPIAKVNFFAYGTLKYGVRINSGSVDGDGYDEIITGAGQGAVFGPHVRGWNYDGSSVLALNKISFFAYGTLKYGVEPTGGDVEADGFSEMITAPGPGVVFSHQIRGFNYDGTFVTAIAKINFNASTARYGGTVAASDVDGDAFDEIVTGEGAGPANPAVVSMFNADSTVTSVATLSPNPFTTLFGANVGPAERDGMPWNEIAVSPGPDPVATADVKSYRAVMRAAGSPVLALSFTAYAASAYGANVHGGYFGY